MTKHPTNVIPFPDHQRKKPAKKKGKKKPPPILFLFHKLYKQTFSVAELLGDGEDERK